MSVHLCICISLQDLLEQLLLEVLPHLAALAGLSQQCSQSLFSICGLAAAACPPRDTITAFLEVMDQLLAAERCGLRKSMIAAVLH